jgi:hypothetical protein
MSSVGYDPVSGVLEIEFRGGAVYQYFMVPKKVYDGLKGAASKGSFFARYIKDRFTYARVS